MQKIVIEGLGQYYITEEARKEEITPIVRTSFIIGIMHAINHTILLLSLRKFLSLDELKTLCGYNAIVNTLLPFFWFPEKSGFIRANVIESIIVRTFLIFFYGCGYFFAGKVQNVGRIIMIGAKQD